MWTLIIGKLKAVKNEFCAIREACLQFEPGYIPKFVFCVVDKVLFLLHIIR